MPYVRQEDRKIIDEKLDPIINDLIINDGELTYIIYKLILGYVTKTSYSYSGLSRCMGILECAKQEFYRRVVSPYEDKKIKENGDIKI